MSHDFKYVKQIWKIINPWFFCAVMLVGVYIMVSFFPKPDWICNTDSIEDNWGSVMPSVSSKALDKNSGGKKAQGPVHNVIDLFPVYLEQNSQGLESGNTEMSQRFPSNISVVKVFHLENFNFSHFGHTWLNDIPEQKLQSLHIEHDSKNQTYSEFILKKLEHETLPDCVKLKVPHGATSTKICVHYPQDDNFISNRLRDTGIWEMELVFQMEEFFKNNPRSQLIDLGCNVGVFTLIAASLAKPVLAVDILPSNLALIQLSIAINDDNMEHVNDDDELHLLGYGKKSWPKYSDLITTVHNAIYSKHGKMFVYLKDDLNLGGTEVKELNIQHETTQNIDPNNAVHTKRHSEKRKQTENMKNLPDSHSSKTATSSTKILVDAVCLDDLIPHVRANRSVFLKMDIEGSEPNAFMCANNFFMHVDVRVILMEVLFHRYSDQGKMMVNFLLRHNMVPSEDATGRKLLDTDLNNMYKWPENIFWIKAR